MNLGKAIKDLRKGQGLSQEELAAHAGLTQAALSRIENGNRPSEETLKKICKALNIPESMVYVAALEKEDVPEDKKFLYDQLFPVIKNMVMQLAGKS